MMHTVIRKYEQSYIKSVKNKMRDSHHDFGDGKSCLTDLAEAEEVIKMGVEGSAI